MDDGHLTEGMSEHTPSPGPMEICNADPDMETDMKITPDSPRSPNFVRSFVKDMAAPPTPSLSAKMSLIELEDEECVCSYNCPDNMTVPMIHEETGHTPSPGPEDMNKSGSILNNTDMKITQKSPRSPNFIVKNKIQDMIVPPTPGLSDRISRIELDDEECVCSYNCYNCPEDMTAPPTTGLSASVSGGGSDQDECVCTYSCEGVHLHQMREYIEEGEEEKRLKEEQALGIKYCLGMEMELPKYKYIEYKPRGSKDKPKLFQGFSVGGGGENSESILLSDISSSKQSQQLISANLDMNISTKPTILKFWRN